MSAEAELYDIAQFVHNVLGCTAVILSLDCPVLAMRHPLLTMFTSDIEFENRCFPSYYASGELTSLLSIEQVHPLRAAAMQKGSMLCINRVGLQTEEAMVGSIAIVPLQRPMGILGSLLCVSEHADAFLQGERRLLELYLPIVAQRVEQTLCDACTLPSNVEKQEKLCDDYEGVKVHEVCTPHTESHEKRTFADVQEQQTLVSLVSHDLRMPLTAIKGYAGLLQAYGNCEQEDTSSAPTELTPELQQHYIDVIMEQTQHMEVLINDLLNVSRIQSGRLALRRTWVDIVPLCQRVAQVMQQKVDQQHAGQYHIRCSLDAQSSLVWADPDRVRQVLTNLVENAVKYSPDGGPIEIQVHTRHASSSITVRDWGMGIPIQQQSSLFRLFRRGEHPIKRNVAGFGLGLYISRKLVEAMDGSIMLHSSEDGGTSVSFTLPKEVPDVASTSFELCSSL